MLIANVKTLTPFDRLIYWIKERQSIYLKKQLGLSKPWSDDTILQQNYFTNVYREQDKVTVWVKNNLRTPLLDLLKSPSKKEPATHTLDEIGPQLVFSILAFRWFNYIPTGDALVDHAGKNFLTDWDLQRVLNLLNVLDEHMKVFTGAFNISNGGSTKPKINRVCEDYIQPAWEIRNSLYTSLRDAKHLATAHKVLYRLPGMGGSGFMAAQVICDLKYTPLFDEYDTDDWDTWSSPGPGSKRGLNILMGRDQEAGININKWDNLINKYRYQINDIITQKEFLPQIGDNNTDMEPLHAQDIQSCFCEYFKYHRLLNGSGNTKRRYTGI